MSDISLSQQHLVNGELRPFDGNAPEDAAHRAALGVLDALVSREALGAALEALEPRAREALVASLSAIIGHACAAGTSEVLAMAKDALHAELEPIGWLVNRGEEKVFFEGAQRPDAARLAQAHCTSFTMPIPLLERTCISNKVRGRLLLAYATAAVEYRRALEQIASGGEPQACALATQTLAAVQDPANGDPRASSVAGVREAQEALRALQSQDAHREQWWAERYERLFRWAHAALDEDRKTEFFNIVANGSAGVNEPAEYAHQLRLALHRAERAEQQLEELQEVVALQRHTHAGSTSA